MSDFGGLSGFDRGFGPSEQYGLPTGREYSGFDPNAPTMDTLQFSRTDPNAWVTQQQDAALTGASGNRVAQELSPTSKTETPGSALQTAGTILSIGAALTSAVGSYYAAKSARYQLKSQESALRFKSEMSNINARMAENQAQQIMESSRQQIGLAALNYSQQQAADRASAAARGLQAGVGSTSEVAASNEYMKRRALWTMDINAVRQASAARMQKANIRAEQAAMLAQAGQLSAMRAGINPGLSAGTTLLGSTGQILSGYGRGLRYQQGNYYGGEA